MLRREGNQAKARRYCLVQSALRAAIGSSVSNRTSSEEAWSVRGYFIADGRSAHARSVVTAAPMRARAKRASAAAAAPRRITSWPINIAVLPVWARNTVHWSCTEKIKCGGCLAKEKANCGRGGREERCWGAGVCVSSSNREDLLLVGGATTLLPLLRKVTGKGGRQRITRQGEGGAEECGSPPSTTTVAC